jgi:hypothetical protein
VVAAELTDAALSRLTGWHELRVLRLRRGETRITGEDIETLARVLHKPVGELYRGLPEARAS